jgi:tRNA(fMet)-specific endonuclease VapC
VKFILDTNVISALMKGEASAVARLARTIPSDVAVPQPVLAEIAYGIERLPRSRRQRRLQERFDLVKVGVARADWSDDVSQAFGRIKAMLEKRGQRIEDFDVAIAAHALSAGATLVTANAEHMVRVPGLRVEDWSRAGSMES